MHYFDLGSDVCNYQIYELFSVYYLDKSKSCYIHVFDLFKGAL